MASRKFPAVTSLLAGIALIGIVALGVSIRADDLLSREVVPAEDPYSHVVFTKEAIERGWFGDSFHLGTTIYPPGIHAFTGAFAPLAGIDLVDFARAAPIALGAFAIIGMFALGSRLGGPAAGVVAALVTAVLPEHVFRTQLFAPTAFDLALLPGWLLLFHFATAPVDGDQRAWRYPARRGAAVAFLFVSIPLAYLHPWLTVLFAIPLALFASLRIARAARPSASIRELSHALAWSAALIVLAAAFAMSTRWDMSDTGFADFFGHIAPLAWLATIGAPPHTLFLILAPGLAIPAMGAVGIAAIAITLRQRIGLRIRIGIAALFVVAVLALLVPALVKELPPAVNYGHMFGATVITFGFIGFALAWLRPSALGDMATSIIIVLFPLASLDLFDSPFWPQRTVAYVGFGVALLAGAAAGAAHEGLEKLAKRRTDRIAWVAPAAIVVVLILAGGALATAPPSNYEWYRLYRDDEYHVLQEVVDELAADPKARVVVYSWQPGLILKAIGDPDQVRYSPKFFRDVDKRESVLTETTGHTFIVIDKFAVKDVARGKVYLAWLDDPAYRVVKSTEDGRVKIYEVIG